MTASVNKKIWKDWVKKIKEKQMKWIKLIKLFNESRETNSGKTKICLEKKPVLLFFSC